MNLFSLYAKIGLDTSEYDQGIKKAQSGAATLKSALNGLSTVFNTVKNAASGAGTVFGKLSTAVSNVGAKSRESTANHKLFASELEKAKAKVETLNQAYIKSVRETGATSDATRKLQSELQQAKSDVSNLAAELEKYPTRLDKAKSAMFKFGSTVANIGKAGIKGIGTGIANGVGVAVKGITAATAAAGAAITALGAIGLNYNSQMETYTTNFEVMLGSQEAAAKKVEELKTMAAKTPFEMSDLAKGTQTLLAFNVASEDTTDVLTSLGDISLGNSEKLDSLTRAYGKMNAAQKVTLEDINMMIDFCPAA